MKKRTITTKLKVGQYLRNIFYDLTFTLCKSKMIAQIYFTLFCEKILLMPFTASHTAIILPLLKRRIFSVSGLLMGSMVPDFEFFIRLEANVVHGHSFWAMFWLNIPIALICISIYHLVVRNQLIINLPLYFRNRFQPYLSFNWISYFKSNYFKVFYSILIGNISHLFWDSFTHFNGFVVTKVAFLNTEFWQVPLFHILQYGFSFLGAIAIWKFISKMPSYKLRGQYVIKNIIGYWLSVFLLTGLVYFLRYDIEDYKDFGASIVFLCAGFMLGLILTSSSFNLALANNNLFLIKVYQTKKP